MAGLALQSSKRYPDPLDGLARVWLRLIVAVAGAGLLAATLFPFAPELPGPSLADWKAEIERRVEWQIPSRGGIRDTVGNVLLFAPVGFGIAGILAARGMRPSRTVAAVSIAAVGLSTVIEVVQLLIPSRDPSAADVVANAVGGLLGAAAFHMFGGAVLWVLARLTAERGSETLSARKLSVSQLLLASLTCVGSISAACLAPLSRWDPDAVLTVGGPGVRDVLIADRAMAVDEVDRTLDRLRSDVTPAAA
jgi:VanZ family protein